MKTLFGILLFAVAGTAHSQTTTTTRCNTLGTVTTCNSDTFDPHQYDYLRDDAWKKDIEAAGQSLGNAIGGILDNLAAKRAQKYVTYVRIVATCNRLHTATRIFSDDSSDEVQLNDVLVEDSDIQQLKRESKGKINIVDDCTGTEVTR